MNTDLLNFLDEIAINLLQKGNGKPKNFLLQTLLEVVGIPTIASAADILGILRGYLNLRQGQGNKGVLEVLTAALPFIPTGPAHYVIEKMLPTIAHQKSTPK